ncbi:MAG TPA: bifunctional 5,10-methylenetetrahydrofolate dehydrogenase/5,10-methenyltetrahydrofolate cyclohydrolase [Candidatus Dormibacteraeota bacterium]|nr:bifunctional 5,10-methylenetetrahydrofolate dehydrogenase/5,10-methenyltetrahydrofolate cyclohydrolase [Candidatus Dormibacteraeota bacterium]
MKLLDGKASAASVLEEVREGVAELVAGGHPRPHLAVVLVGDNPASETYVRNKRRDCERVGITSSDHRLPADATTAQVIALTESLNSDPEVTGILIQQPFPEQVEVAPVVAAVDPDKDVDGFHPLNAGRLLLGEPGLVACTPAGILRLLDDHGIELRGSRAVVVGRSNIVGKPTAQLLLRRHATVTVCHSRTRDLADVCRQADVLVAAIGRPHHITPDMVAEGAAVVDVGISPVDGRLQGDVHPDVAERAGWLSPVPGGVGPMTRAMLMANTLTAGRRWAARG